MWKNHTIEPGILYNLSLGRLCINFKKQGKEWFLKSEMFDEVTGTSGLNIAEANQDLAGCIVYSADKNQILHILPALPDKPLVIKPQKDFKLLPKTSCSLRIKIPIWVQLYHSSPKQVNLILEAPTLHLSKTWVGEPDDGVLAYALRNNPEDLINPGNPQNDQILCYVKVSNLSNSVLDFQRLLIHTDQMGLYAIDNQLYSNNIHVKFKGEGIISDYIYSEPKIETAENAVKIADPRNPEKLGALKRSFVFIKSLTQY